MYTSKYIKIVQIFHFQQFPFRFVGADVSNVKIIFVKFLACSTPYSLRRAAVLLYNSFNYISLTL
jgi:hypothetical protein